MILGYNTNGLAHHDPLQAVELLAELGYGSVAITIDHSCLNPYADDLTKHIESMRRALERHGMRSVIETGARFLLDPRHKHEPTLVSSDSAARAVRVQFLKHAIDIASRLDSDCISFWSGVVRDRDAEGANDDLVWTRLMDSLLPVIAYSATKNVAIGFEPEPGMFIDTMARYAELLDRLKAHSAATSHFQLTLDIGHLHCLGETPLADQIARWAPRLVNVHLEDMRRGMHEHLMFGQGEINFPPVMAALKAANYRGGIHVELSRHSHEGPTAARQALEFLRPLV